MTAGHIRARGPGAWELKYDLGRDPITGKRRIRYETVHGSKRDAQRRLRELLFAVDKDAHVDPSRLTVAELVAERIKLSRDNGRISAKTAERRDWLLRGQIARIGGISVQKLRTIDIERWHAGMLAEGLHPRTIRDAHSLLAQSLDGAMKDHLVNRNVARLERAPKVPHQEIEIIPAEAIAPTLAKLDGHPWHAAVIVALYSGLRRGEQLALTWADVDLNARKIRIERALEETNAGIVTKAPKTKAGRRDVSLPEVVVDALREHRRQQLEIRMALGLGKMPDDSLVFPNHDFRHQSPKNFSTNWMRLVKRLGLPRITWHAWRHTHASMLIDAKVDIATIAKRLGHASPMITLQTYTHCFKQDDRAAADAIDALAR
jgi:integrase